MHPSHHSWIIVIMEAQCINAVILICFVCKDSISNAKCAHPTICILTYECILVRNSRRFRGPRWDLNTQPSDPCRMLYHFSYRGQISYPMLLFEVKIFRFRKLTFELLTVPGQQHSFSTEDYMLVGRLKLRKEYWWKWGIYCPRSLNKKDNVAIFTSCWELNAPGTWVWNIGRMNAYSKIIIRWNITRVNAKLMGYIIWHMITYIRHLTAVKSHCSGSGSLLKYPAQKFGYVSIQKASRLRLWKMRV